MKSKFGTIYKVLYATYVPESIVEILIGTTPSMESYESTEHVYNMDGIIGDYKAEPSDFDKEETQFIEYLISEGIDYIEL